jgi:thiamine-phosphate pyrophosphorylase
VDACIAGGVDIVQLRDKHLGARAVLERAAVARDVCRSHRVPFVLNDRPDLALELDADGVHVGQDDAPPALARRILGAEKLLGLSTHAPGELDAARREPVDYLSVGPVVPTATHPNRAPTGLGYVRHAASVCDKPFFVTGGVTPESVAGLAALGARRFVVVRYITEASDPRAAAGRLRDAIDACGDQPV